MSELCPDRCSLLTPPGAGAIAIVRLTGPNAKEILERVFRPHSHRLQDDQANAVSYGRIMGWDSLVLDDVLVAPAPSLASSDHERSLSFDITSHGGIRVVERIIKVLTQAGASHRTESGSGEGAWGGVTTMERETNQELCQARTQRAVRFLGHQRLRLAGILERLASMCECDPGQAREALWRLIQSQKAAHILLHGARIALVGPPNSGKSSLFNHLARRRAAVVSPRAGTTRDWVTASVEFEGIPVDLHDTAGVDAATDDLEQKAMDTGQAVASGCELVIIVIDASHPNQRFIDGEFQRYEWQSSRRVIAINKIDLPVQEDRVSGPSCGMCRVSAETGAGIPDLIRTCLDSLGLRGFEDSLPSLFNHRQLSVAQRALGHLGDAPEQAAALIRCELIGQKSA